MTADPADTLQALWQTQEQEIPPVTLDEIRAKAAAFERKIRRRNLREYIGTAVAAAIFASYIWLFPGWMIKLGSALTILALGWTMWRLQQRGNARAAGGDARTVVDAYRDALVRQYRGAAAFCRRDLPLFLPGLILIYVGRYRQDHAGGRPLDLDHTFIILGGVIGLLMLAIVVLVSLLGAARLQNQINELDRMLRG
ncbi:hypothetical protein [Nitrospirillum amazonense]|uniref:Uncharacterized protein n=1 Tax=Nitrospirillum amazonense TaxID=28077 RepID=A0A560JGA7_9PROT|nr:hypothetical protein [Nitrospirillum amazonense]MDG3442542.1 hypothetical protein [Nitrospirillum amazonense]TWB68384.1 hypothetical protein FBZ87_11186 [Nitrospirillum amazonense]